MESSDWISVKSAVRGVVLVGLVTAVTEKAKEVPEERGLVEKVSLAVSF